MENGERQRISDKISRIGAWGASSSGPRDENHVIIPLSQLNPTVKQARGEQSVGTPVQKNTDTLTAKWAPGKSQRQW